MPNNTQLLQMFDRWTDWMLMCSGLPMTAPACIPLWEWVMYGSATAGAMLVLWSLWRILDYRLKYAAAIRAQLERERVAEPEVMAQHRFKEAGDVTEEVTDPKLAEKIRAELERQKLERLTGRPMAKPPAAP